MYSNISRQNKIRHTAHCFSFAVITLGLYLLGDTSGISSAVGALILIAGIGLLTY